MDKMQLSQLMTALDEMAGMIAKIRESMPTDSAEEESAAIDESTAEEEVAGETEESLAPADDKQLKKAAAVAMIRKSI
jgi:hypothetical protein